MIEGDSILLIKKIWDIVVWIILIIEAILILLFCVPNLFAVKPYVITSGSMIPKYPVGSVIYVKKTDSNDIKVGDSVTFYMNHSKIVATHEVYAIDSKNKYFYTQGINNLDENKNIIHDANPVRFSDVIGSPILCIPYLGYVNKAITKSPGMYFIIVFTIAIIIISSLFDRINKKKKTEGKS